MSDPHIEEIHIGEPVFDSPDIHGQVCVNQYLFSDAIAGSLLLARRISTSQSLEEAKKHAREAETEWTRVMNALKLDQG